jgi:hypothetical protein
VPFLLLAASLALTGTPPQAAPRPAAVEIEIQDWRIQIPALPASVEQAHAQYGEVAPRMQRALKDLDQEVTQLLASEACRAGLPTALRVRSEDAPAAKFFARMLNDTDYAHLRGEAIQAWNGWQAALLDQGLARGAQPAAPRPGPTPKETFAQDRRQAQLRKFAEDAIQDDLAFAQEVATPLGGGVDPKTFQRLHADTVRQETGLGVALQVKTIANQQVPRLAQAWQPLADHLHACAARLVELDTPGGSEDLARLKAHAKLAFLENCRATLWFSQRVWTRMTSHEDPPPLARLRP